MLNLNDSKETSTNHSKNNNSNIKKDLSLMDLFNCKYSQPKSLKGDNNIINLEKLDKSLNSSLNLKKTLFLSQKFSNLYINKKGYKNKHFSDNNLIENNEPNSENNISETINTENSKRLILQKRFENGYMEKKEQRFSYK